MAAVMVPIEKACFHQRQPQSPYIVSPTYTFNVNVWENERPQTHSVPNATRPYFLLFTFEKIKLLDFSKMAAVMVPIEKACFHQRQPQSPYIVSPTYTFNVIDFVVV